jgi:hypothetical protein
VTAAVPLVERLAEVLAGHQSEQLWKPGGWVGDTACSCGWRMAMWSRKDFPEVHRKHVAEALLPVVEQVVAEARGEAWDEGFTRGFYDILAGKFQRDASESTAENPYRADAIATTEEAPTMSQADCRCPDDCDCDGRFACEEPVSGTTHRCELAVGHRGWHVSGNHRWETP